MTRIIRKRRESPFPLPLPLELFAATGRGLEETLHGEIRSLLPESRAACLSGGVTFRADIPGLCSALLNLRTATRILIRLFSCPAPDPDTLHDGVRNYPWHELISPTATIAVSTTLRQSCITHSHYASLRVKDGVVDEIRDHSGVRPSVDTTSPDVPVHLHLHRDEATLFLDPSGISLDHRGYRTERGDAPIREHLAAALVLLSGWDGSSPLYDPFCGSATIPIEAAMIASRVPPGLVRKQPALLKWPWFPRREWETALDEARRGIVPCTVPIIGSDSDERSIARASRIVSSLPFTHTIRLQQKPFADFTPSEGDGTIICNPPYGRRLGDEESLIPLYREIGNILKQRCAGSRAFVIAPQGPLVKALGLRPHRRFPLFNGPIDCRLLAFDLYRSKSPG